MVRPGDTLSQIAQRYGVRLDDLRRWNRLSSDAIAVGQRLEISAPASTCIVRPGDTLSEIAHRHGLSTADLRRLNGLTNDRIRPGQVLRLRGQPERPARYVVRPGDTLSEIAVRFDVELALLRQLNDLEGDRIRAGQRLRLQPSPKQASIHVVLPGQTLYQIAALYDIGVGRLRHLNGVEGDLIRPGQKLRLRPTPATVHVVERGDALWEIARAYGLSVADLKALNRLRGDSIFPGQRLLLGQDRRPRLASHTVVRGDNLSEIAQLHQMSVAELRRLNDLSGMVIHPGQKLKVRPLLGRPGGLDPSQLDPSRIPWERLLVDVAGLRRIALENGPYYGQRPRARRQPSRQYAEKHPPSPLRTYRQARKLWDRFEGEVGRLGRLGNDLAGWHFVLDPGHGGIDPGAIVRTISGDGTRLYVVEDEYVYDITLRAYVLLRLHGAKVDITMLSPNHLIRRTEPATQTFVHQQNEVFNSLALNRSNQWPFGNSRGLKARVQIAKDALRHAPGGRTIFLSFHADHDPNSPQAPLVLYYERRGKRDDASRRFARALLPALGAGARTRGQSLAVLRGNPASVKVLVEVANLAYVDHAWALRFEQHRQREAEKVVRGVLDYVRRKQLARR
ncbi:MAG: LysM peptidoglycan-binding domain-containing protein [Gemmatimonadaceae bacterium]|nr:LysM peptidoglycan-binding domain-containing protein [Gemmatimonadaceae bacterium]